MNICLELLRTEKYKTDRSKDSYGGLQGVFLLPLSSNISFQSHGLKDTNSLLITKIGGCFSFFLSWNSYQTLSIAAASSERTHSFQTSLHLAGVLAADDRKPTGITYAKEDLLKGHCVAPRIKRFAK